VPSRPSVILLVADGARPDTIATAIARGDAPALARLRDDGALHTVTTVFPSVTGPAYIPFLTGMHPATVGLPGLRWYDRGRTVTSWPDYARSYIGPQHRYLDRDLAPHHPTLFEHAPSRLGALSVIRRGLAAHERLDHGLGFLARTAWMHARGDVAAWLALDREIGDQIVRRVRAERPTFTFAAFTGIDKLSHDEGHAAPSVVDALKIVDDVAHRLRTDAERAGAWHETHLWIVSDHGHAPVHAHDDLADRMRDLGYRVLAHPRVWTRRPEVAVMVSGNAMAHLYCDLARTTRPWWHALTQHWRPLLDALLARPSVDFVLTPVAPGACEMHTGSRGSATLTWNGTSYRYLPRDGDPLGIGPITTRSRTEAYDATRDSEYPDALVQIALISDGERSGDLICSAAPGWDFRARFEPIPHRSSHGSLRRAHMLVPLLTNHPVARVPRRTVDVMPSVATLLSAMVPPTHGESFV